MLRSWRHAAVRLSGLATACPLQSYRSARLRRHYASLTDLSNHPAPGQRLHGFTLQRAEHVSELELTALHFRHDQTGADYLHIARDDTNNVFAIAFKTNPPDATGVPHVLEHTTLCGSEKYPVRDPFFKMMPRSLQNFMNAFTSSDHTMYPFATTNAQDFSNLMSVYLDATLHPLLNRSDFLQEGWRIGPENPHAPAKDDQRSDLVFKGVVYNEMKGQMSDATYLFFIRFMEHIFPSINNSGGDPTKMTDLTYEQLKDFHANHYHPSNSKILTYGDQPVERHLRFLSERLNGFNKRDLAQDIKSAITLKGPRTVTLQGPVDPLTPLDAQYKTSTTWLAGDPNDVHEAFALQIALSLILDGYGSPMYRALIESGLGSDFTPNTGYLGEGRKAIFSIGLNGVKQENVAKVHSQIASTLKEVIAKGLDKTKVDGMLHQLELGLKHKTANFGLGAVQRVIGKWFNGQDPYEVLAFNKFVDQFESSYAQGGYLEGLLKKYLLVEDTMTFTMQPSTTYAADLAGEEANRLKTKIDEAVKNYPSEPEAYKHLRERELELVREQDAGRTQSLESLPTLRVSDIPRQQAEKTVRDSGVGHAQVQWRETATNGLTYFRAVAPFASLPDELRMLVPLFCNSLMRIGTKTMTVEQLEDMIKLKTGGVSFGHSTITSPFDVSEVKESFSLSGFAFDRNIPAMYELLQTLLLETDFDSPNAHGMICQLLQASASGAVDEIASSGHSYARRYAEAGVSPEARLSEATGGLTQIRLITKLAASGQRPEAMAELVSQLKRIQGLAVANMRSSMRVSLTCGADAVGENEVALQKFLLATWGASTTPPADVAISQPRGEYAGGRRTFFNLPYQVSYSALAVRTGPYASSSSAPVAVLAKLLTHKHLHHEIREKGGAYGGGAYSKGLQGVFGMFSYRDPNPENTLGIYADAARWAAEKDWSDVELEEAKLGIFQDIDAPISVNQEGMMKFLSGVDHDMEQRRRQWLLDVDKKQVQEAAERMRQAVSNQAFVTVLGDGGKQKFQKDGSWTIEELGMQPGHEGEDSIKK